jgi:hypothetical protein
MMESHFEFGRDRGIDGGGDGIVSILLDAELDRFLRDAQKFTEAGNPGLTPES